MNLLRDQIVKLETAADDLSKATSTRDKVKHADRIYEILGECDRLIEQFVVTQIGSTNGRRGTVPTTQQRPRKYPKTAKRFTDMKLAEVGKALLKEHGTLHGSKIETLAKAGGFKSKAEHFQSYLSVAFKRDGGFVNTGQNNWKLKEEAGTQSA